MFQDLRFQIRQLLRNPGFTTIAILTMALGIGATTAMFSVVDAVLLRALPYYDPQRLIAIYEDYSSLGFPRKVTSPGSFQSILRQRQLFEDVAGVATHSDNLVTPGGASVALIGGEVTHNLFSVLGVKPLIGRIFQGEEDTPGNYHFVLLSYELWMSRFGGNRSAVGQAIRINAEPYTVLGVMPAGFAYPENDIELWTPRPFTAQDTTRFDEHYLTIVGRLRPGVSLPQANAALSVLASRALREHPDDTKGLSRFFAEPLQDQFTHDARRGLILLMGAVGCILLIACANLANLLLSRGTGRQREMALRAAIGASQSRIARQLLTEGVLLGLIGGSLGTLLGSASFSFLKALIPLDLSRTVSLQFDFRILAFAIGTSIASSLLFGMVPAIAGSKIDLNQALKEGGRGNTNSRSTRWGNIFVVCEVSLSLVLLLGATLLTRTLFNLRHVNPGFQSQSVLTAEFFLSEPKYRDFETRSLFIERVLNAVRALPGVQAAGFTSVLPMTWKGGTMTLTPEGAVAGSAVLYNANERVVTPGYFETLAISLIRGRFFNERDRQGDPRVAIVNQTMARRFWPNESVIGKRFRAGGATSNAPWIQVIGVAGDIRQMGLSEPPRQEVYFPYWQAADNWMQPRGLVVRTNVDPMSVVSAVRGAVARLDPAEPLTHVLTMSDILEHETAQSKTQTVLLTGLAALALVMSCVGIYGVVAYMVAQRVQEMGVRMALGAKRIQVMGLVLRKGMLLAFLGVAFGLVASLAASKIMRVFLFEVSPTDPTLMAVASGLLLAVALVACFIPAQRAASIDPLKALRCE